MYARARFYPVGDEYPVLVTRPRRYLVRKSDIVGLICTLVWNAFACFTLYCMVTQPHIERAWIGWTVGIVFLIVGVAMVALWVFYFFVPRYTLYVLTNRRVIIQKPCFLSRTPTLISYKLHRNLVRSVRHGKGGGGDIVFDWEVDADNPHAITPCGFMDIPDLARVENAIDERVAQMQQEEEKS